MYIAGAINRPVFSIYLTWLEEQSKIYFGGYDQSIIEKAGTQGTDSKNKSKDGIFWMNVGSEDHWQVNNYGCKIGDHEIKDHVDVLIFDTGASQIWMPNPEYD